MTAPKAITPGVRKAVRVIRENTRGTGLAYLAPAGRGRWAIVAEHGPDVRRVHAIGSKTFDLLIGLKLADLEDCQANRHDFRSDYIGRRHLDSRYGYPITLTDKGRSL